MPVYRQSSIKNNLYLRSRVIQAVRSFFSGCDYLEIDTPIRNPTSAPEAHIDAVASENCFLQTSPELFMKRMLAAGYSRIFQICKCFRRGERGRKHLPELTMLEWYAAGKNYLDLMEECEKLIIHVLHNLGREEKLNYGGRRIEIAAPWLRLPVSEAFQQFASISMDEALETDTFDGVMALEIEPNLGNSSPVFLYDYPARHGALARIKPQNPGFAERFELYIAGLELCNGFSELTDAAEQRDRFEKELQLRRSMHKTIYPMPDKFLKSLSDMPEAAGNALGIDRLVMLLADTAEIDDVVAFTPEEL